MQVDIDHPHAKAIAAYYSGKRIRFVGFTQWWKPYTETNSEVQFNVAREFEIEPEVVVKYVMGYVTQNHGVVFSVNEFDSIAQGHKYYCKDVGALKKTYTDGKLTAVELVETNNV